MLYFSHLHIGRWRQFSNIDIDLTKQVTILTGQNGCGKTTLLNLLSKHFGWSLRFVSTPYMGKKRAQRLWSDVFDFDQDGFYDDSSQSYNVGTLQYSNDAVCNLITNTIVTSQYEVAFSNLQPVEGMHIPSHRPVATYNNIQNIPTNPKSATQDYHDFQQLLVQVYGGGKAENPGKVQKQSLISLAVFGEGNSSVQPNPEMKSIFDGFQEVLRKVMPESIGFQRLDIRMPEIVLITSSGTFSLDAMSGGINAIFSIAWQIYMFGYNKDNFVVTIDEPENHLHPSMQRTFLINLAAAFPSCKIIVSTHSPFIVSSFHDANIYGLIRGVSGIESQKLDLRDISGTPNEVLREVLYVDSNLPVWVEELITKTVKESESSSGSERAAIIMATLARLGIADAIVEYKNKGE